MYTILLISYLFLPVVLLFSKDKRKSLVLILLAAYGVFAFAYLQYDIEKLPQTSRAAYAFSYTTIEYLFFASFFYLSIPNKRMRQLIAVLSGGFVIFQVLFYYSVRFDSYRLDSIPIGVETILLFVYIFLFFYEALKSTKHVNIYNSFGFWIAVGVLLYLGVSFFFYILANQMNQTEIELYWDVTFVAEIIKNIVFCVAILTYVSNPNQPKKNMSRSPDSVPHLI